jgi:hypothetical protein
MITEDNNDDVIIYLLVGNGFPSEFLHISDFLITSILLYRKGEEAAGKWNL